MVLNITQNWHYQGILASETNSSTRMWLSITLVLGSPYGHVTRIPLSAISGQQHSAWILGLFQLNNKFVRHPIYAIESQITIISTVCPTAKQIDASNRRPLGKDIKQRANTAESVAMLGCHHRNTILIVHFRIHSLAKYWSSSIIHKTT